MTDSETNPAAATPEKLFDMALDATRAGSDGRDLLAGLAGWFNEHGGIDLLATVKGERNNLLDRWISALPEYYLPPVDIVMRSLGARTGGEEWKRACAAALERIVTHRPYESAGWIERMPEDMLRGWRDRYNSRNALLVAIDGLAPTGLAQAADTTRNKNDVVNALLRRGLSLVEAASGKTTWLIDALCTPALWDRFVLENGDPMLMLPASRTERGEQPEYGSTGRRRLWQHVFVRHSGEAMRQHLSEWARQHDPAGCEQVRRDVYWRNLTLHRQWSGSDLLGYVRAEKDWPGLQNEDGVTPAMWLAQTSAKTFFALGSGSLKAFSGNKRDHNGLGLWPYLLCGAGTVFAGISKRWNSGSSGLQKQAVTCVERLAQSQESPESDSGWLHQWFCRGPGSAIDTGTHCALVCGKSSMDERDNERIKKALGCVLSQHPEHLWGTRQEHMDELGDRLLALFFSSNDPTDRLLQNDIAWFSEHFEPHQVSPRLAAALAMAAAAAHDIDSAPVQKWLNRGAIVGRGDLAWQKIKPYTAEAAVLEVLTARYIAKSLDDSLKAAQTAAAGGGRQTRRPGM